MAKQSPLFLDVECYSNYFLLVFKDLTGKYEYFEKDENNQLPVERIKKLLETKTTIGFNSRMYDIPMITYALSGISNELLKEMSDRIINETTYDVLCTYNLWTPRRYDHIDLINVAAGRNGSLKMCGARIHTTNLQDLPYDPAISLNDKEKLLLKRYCFNDVEITKDLYLYLEKEVKVREAINKEYDVDVRSKSDAQTADVLVEKVLRSKVSKIEEYCFKYTPPNYISFKTTNLKDIFNKFKAMEFEFVKGDKLKNTGLVLSCKLNDTEYTTGIGGLHSTEKSRSVVATNDEYLIDVDVISYYPTIILNNGYCPDRYEADEFIPFLKKIYDDRLVAKLNQDKTKSDMYKIILNGLYGKYGDKYSKLYSPELLINTTVTGQLSLLMLIETLELKGYRVVSANTDGITVLLPKIKYSEFKTLLKQWENTTSLKTEEVRYKSLHNQSVNSYVAVREDGSLKCKGALASNDLSRNPAVKICKEAVFAYILNNKPIEQTIAEASDDQSNFIIVRKVADGGYWKNNYLGKVVRWYWSIEGESITNPKNHKVSGTDDAYPLMNLQDPISNLHYEKYITKAYEMLESIGITNLKQT